MNKYKDEIIDFLFTSISILVLFSTILIVNSYILNNFENVIAILLIHLVVIIVIFYSSKVLKIDFQYRFFLIMGYVLFHIYLLFLSKNGTEPQFNNPNTSIKEKSIFRTEEQKKKYSYGSIEDKIIILKNIGLSKNNILNQLKNNTEFKELTKYGFNKFNLIYSKNDEKQKKKE